MDLKSEPGAFYKYLLPVFLIIGLLILWQILCTLFEIPVWLLPSPGRIITSTVKWARFLPMHTGVTLYETVAGFFLSLVIGLPLAILVVYSAVLRNTIYPILLVFQSVPKVAIAPLFLIWIGYGEMSKVLIAAIVAFFPIVVNTATGLESVEPEILELSRSLHATKLQIFFKIRFPWALPHIFSGMKVAISLAVVGAVIGEFVGSDRGLGYLILAASGEMNTALIFGVMAILALVGIVTFTAIALLEKWICPWYIESGVRE
ncbi:MAG: ABC transporter permease [Proteobacteria bacterium]|nr:ABC transporter permease [Pseudomonadota bacterium]